MVYSFSETEHNIFCPVPQINSRSGVIWNDIDQAIGKPKRCKLKAHGNLKLDLTYATWKYEDYT